MRSLIFILTVSLVSYTLPADPKTITGWVIERSSTMSIEGSSNISAFTCDLKEYLSQDTLYYSKDEKAKKLLAKPPLAWREWKGYGSHRNLLKTA